MPSLDSPRANPETSRADGNPTRGRTTRPEDRVGFWEKTALGIGALPLSYGNIAVKSFAIPVYQMTLGVNPALLGAVLAIPRFWDAFTDPVMGNISDNFHSRWGRRKPLIVLGALLQGLTFGLIWMVPSHWSPDAALWYLVATLLLFYTCYTIYSVPLHSLNYEMTADYEERTRVAAFSGFFIKVSSFTYQWIFPLSQLTIFGSTMMGVRTVGWCIGILVMAGVGMIPGFFVKERFYKKASHQKKVRLLEALRHAVRNRAFVVLMILSILQTLPAMLSSSLDYYLIVYSMCGGDVVEGSVWKGILSSAYAIVGLAAIYPVTWLANRYSKRFAFAVIFVMVALGGVAKWFIYTPGNMWKILLDPLLSAPIWTALGILMTSMLADICDEDELRHRQRREGMFGAIYSWFHKTAMSLAFLISGITLTLAGFDTELGGNQHSGTILTLRTVLAAAPVLWAVLALITLRFYPITRERAYEVRDALEARRGATGDSTQERG